MEGPKRIAPPAIVADRGSGLVGRRHPRAPRAARHRAGALHRRHPPAADALGPPRFAARIRTRASSSIDATRALARKGVVAVITGRDMPETLRHHPLDAGRVSRSRSRRRASSATPSPPSPRRTSASPTRRPSSSTSSTRSSRPRPISTPRSTGPRSASARAARTTSRRRSSSSSATSTDCWPSSDVVIEGDYYYEGSAHVPIETHCAIGQLDKNGLLTVWSATQVPHYLHRELSRVLRISPARIRVIQPPVGGAFGGKSEPFSLEFCAAKLAMITGPPGEVPLHARGGVLRAPRPPPDADAHEGRRDERRQAHRGRHAAPSIDGGAYSSFGLVTAYYSGQLLTLPAFAEGVPLQLDALFTNKPPCGPKRGHGSVQPRFAFEVLARQDRDARSGWIRSSFAGGTWSRRTRRRSTACASPRTASSSASTRVEAASGWKERRGKLGLRQGPRRRGERVHQRDQLLHLPERDAAERGAAQGRSLRRRHRLLRAERDRAGLRSHARGARRRRARARSRRGARRLGRHRSHARSTSARTRRAARS